MFEYFYYFKGYIEDIILVGVRGGRNEVGIRFFKIGN